MAAVEFPEESATDDSRICQRMLDRFEMAVVQTGIAMLEHDHVSTAGGGPEIHLLAAIRRGAGDERGAGRECDLPGPLIARSVDHDGFRNALVSRERR